MDSYVDSHGFLPLLLTDDVQKGLHESFTNALLERAALVCRLCFEKSEISSVKPCRFLQTASDAWQKYVNSHKDSNEPHE